MFRDIDAVKRCCEVSEAEEAADLDIPPDARLFDKADQDEVDFAEMMEAGAGIEEPKQEQKSEETFSDSQIEDVEIISEEAEATEPEVPALAEAFDELIEIEEEFGLITPEGELNRTVAEKLVPAEPEVLPQEDDFADLLPEADAWDIRENYVPSDNNNGPSAIEKHKLSFDELLDTLSAESLTSDDNTEVFDLLIDETIDDPFSADEASKPSYAVGEPVPSIAREKDTLVKESGMANALKFYEAENYTAAINEAVELVHHYPDDCKLHVLLGNAYFRTQRYHEAAQEYEQVIKLDPRSVDAYENLGVVYANQGDLHRAVYQWEQLLGISPERKDIRDSINRAKRFLQQA